MNYSELCLYFTFNSPFNYVYDIMLVNHISYCCVSCILGERHFTTIILNKSWNIDWLKSRQIGNDIRICISNWTIESSTWSTSQLAQDIELNYLFSAAPTFCFADLNIVIHCFIITCETTSLSPGLNSLVHLYCFNYVYIWELNCYISLIANHEQKHTNCALLYIYTHN